MEYHRNKVNIFGITDHKEDENKFKNPLQKTATFCDLLSDKNEMIINMKMHNEPDDLQNKSNMTMSTHTKINENPKKSTIPTKKPHNDYHHHYLNPAHHPKHLTDSNKILKNTSTPDDTHFWNRVNKVIEKDTIATATNTTTTTTTTMTNTTTINKKPSHEHLKPNGNPNPNNHHHLKSLNILLPIICQTPKYDNSNSNSGIMNSCNTINTTKHANSKKNMKELIDITTDIMTLSKNIESEYVSPTNWDNSKVMREEIESEKKNCFVIKSRNNKSNIVTIKVKNIKALSPIPSALPHICLQNTTNEHAFNDNVRPHNPGLLLSPSNLHIDSTRPDFNQTLMMSASHNKRYSIKGSEVSSPEPHAIATNTINSKTKIARVNLSNIKKVDEIDNLLMNTATTNGALSNDSKLKDRFSHKKNLLNIETSPRYSYQRLVESVKHSNLNNNANNSNIGNKLIESVHLDSTDFLHFESKNEAIIPDCMNRISQETNDTNYNTETTCTPSTSSVYSAKIIKKPNLHKLIDIDDGSLINSTEFIDHHSNTKPQKQQQEQQHEEIATNKASKIFPYEQKYYGLTKTNQRNQIKPNNNNNNINDMIINTTNTVASATSAISLINSNSNMTYIMNKNHKSAMSPLSKFFEMNNQTITPGLDMKNLEIKPKTKSKFKVEEILVNKLFKTGGKPII